MASFARSTTVIQFPDRSARPDVASKTVALLWPMFGWRVLAPMPRPRELNIAQKAVLGLLAAGLKLDPIAEHLELDRDLVALIILELSALGLADQLGKLTIRGQSTLEAETVEPSEEAVVGWVFTDACTGKVWPAFVPGELPVAPTEPDAEGWQRLVPSRGSGQPRPAFTVLPDSKHLQRLRPRDIDVLGAARMQRRLDRLEDVPLAQQSQRLQQVSFIADQPEPFFLATRCVRYPDGEWAVQDPLRGGESRDLRKLLEARLDSHPGLRQWLAGVIAGDVTDETLKAKIQQATWDIETALSIRIREHTQMHAALVAMQRSILECSSPTAPDDKWNDAIVKIQKAMEGALLETLTRDAARRALARFPLRCGKHEDADFNAHWVETTARDLGFETPLPEGLLRVRGGKVRSALEIGTGTLRPMALACLLVASNQPNHPLRRLAKTHPDFFASIHQLATWRDAAAHFSRSNARSDHRERPSLAELEACARTAVEITRHLLLGT